MSIEDVNPGELADDEIARLHQAVTAGRVALGAALWRAFALGAEVERLEAARRACNEYDRARAARIEAFNAERGRPSSTPPPRG